MEKIAFTKAIEQNKEIICQTLNLDEPIRIDDILACPELSEAYKSMIAAERDVWVLREKLRLESSPAFDFRTHTNLCFEFETMLKQIAIVPFGDVRSFIENFVRLRLNFLCRPRTTLKHFIFRESLEISTEQFLKYLAYFTDYEYIYQGFYDLIAKESEKGNKTISLYKFEKALEHIDNTFILNLDEIEFISLVQPIFDFFSIDSETLKQAPSDAFILFFNDKKLNYVAYLIENEYGGKNISRDELLDLLKKHLLKIQTAELTETIEQSVLEEITVPESSSEYLTPELSDNLTEQISYHEIIDEDIDQVIEEITEDEINLLNENLEESFERKLENEFTELIEETGQEQLLSDVSSYADDTQDIISNEFIKQDEQIISDFDSSSTEIIEQSDLVSSIELQQPEYQDQFEIASDISEQEESLSYDIILDNSESEQPFTVNADEMLNYFNEELTEIEKAVSEENNFDKVYEIEKQIIEKAAELIASEKPNLELDLPIDNVQITEIPSFEFKNDLSSSLANFLSKIIPSEKKDELTTPDDENLDVINNFSSEIEQTDTMNDISETELLNQFVSSDLETNEISTLDKISAEIDNENISLDDLNTTDVDFKLDDESGELVCEQVDSDVEKFASEIYNFNEELIENMKAKNKKAITSDEDIDPDLLLLNRKDTEDEVR